VRNKVKNRAPVAVSYDSRNRIDRSAVNSLRCYRKIVAVNTSICTSRTYRNIIRKIYRDYSRILSYIRFVSEKYVCII